MAWLLYGPTREYSGYGFHDEPLPWHDQEVWYLSFELQSTQHKRPESICLTAASSFVDIVRIRSTWQKRSVRGTILYLGLRMYYNDQLGELPESQACAGRSDQPVGTIARGSRLPARRFTSERMYRRLERYDVSVVVQLTAGCDSQWNWEEPFRSRGCDPMNPLGAIGAAIRVCRSIWWYPSGRKGSTILYLALRHVLSTLTVE